MHLRTKRSKSQDSRVNISVAGRFRQPLVWDGEAAVK